MKKSVVLFGVGLVLLVVGGFLCLNAPPKADKTTMAQCRAKLSANGADAALIDQCSERAFAAQMTATDAASAAKAISAANNSETGVNTLGMFLLGFGVVTLAGGWMARKKESAIA